jgi:hypothetical protein
MPLTFLESGATIDGSYRYHLWRTWNPDTQRITFIMCNPSTADGFTDDPTIRRCIDIAQAWAFGSLSVVNLFAYRSPSPQALFAVTDPVGPANETYLAQAAAQSACIIAAWGNAGQYRGRDREVMGLLSEYASRLFCLGLNQSGSPKHPLYIKKGTECYAFSL